MMVLKGKGHCAADSEEQKKLAKSAWQSLVILQEDTAIFVVVRKLQKMSWVSKHHCYCDISYTINFYWLHCKHCYQQCESYFSMLKKICNVLQIIVTLGPFQFGKDVP